MGVRVVFPVQLHGLTAPFELQSGCLTVGQGLADLAERLPAVHARLVTEQGALRPHINLFVDGEDIRYSGGLETSLDGAAELVVMRAVSGG